METNPSMEYRVVYLPQHASFESEHGGRHHRVSAEHDVIHRTIHSPREYIVMSITQGTVKYGDKLINTMELKCMLEDSSYRLLVTGCFSYGVFHCGEVHVLG